MNATAVVRQLGTWQQHPGSPGADLERALSEAILIGRVPVGARLPSERTLAASLGISRGTVSAVYARLRAGGWLATRGGSGSTTALPDALNARMASPGGWRDASDELNPERIDLTYAAPIAPVPEYLRAVEAASAGLRGLALTPVVGELGELREAVAARYTADGLPTDPGQVLITSGAAAALAFAFADVAPPGSRLLVESPTYAGALDVARAHGVRLVGWPILDGWSSDVFGHMADQHRVRAAYVSFDFHNPTGALADSAQREAIVAAAHRRDIALVVDETLRDLSFADEVRPPVTRGAGVLVGSLSKTVWAGLRVGWVRAEARVADRLRSQPLVAALVPPPLEQLIALELLPRLEVITAQRRTELRRNLELLERTVDAWKGCELSGPRRGGLSTWLRLPPGVSSVEVVRRLRDQHVLMPPGTAFSPDATLDGYLRIPLTPDHERLATALSRLRAVLVDQS